MGARILVTGVTNVQGALLAAGLAARPEVDRVVGLDTRTPDPELAAIIDHVEADVRTQDLARLLRPHRLTAIVHNDIHQFPEPGRAGRSLHDINVVGTLALLTAAASLPELEVLVVRGSAAIYGAEPAGPAFWREEDLPPGADRERLRTRFQRDVAEIEQLVAVFARRHPDVACTTLRMQPVVGGALDSPIARLVRAPLVPTYLGFDPRVQVIHLEDATRVLIGAVGAGARGTVNAGAPAPVSLSRALRSIGRPSLPIVAPLYGTVVGLAARVGGLPALSIDMARYLRFGRVVDLTRQEHELGLVPERDTLAALVATAAEPAIAEAA
ncbi:MAG: NAD-dependent epimerase/dehydratase family protein [Solirubrobacterales bacterium]|nr:NAD-dependent epimerase/dehydratase family protein [Solirubrobacterales bacterium]